MDNFVSGGEVSQIVIVALLLIATAVVGALAIRRRWIAALAVWIWLPVVHLAKHMLGLPDMLQPNTYSSILLLGIFALAVTVVGTGCGVLVRRLVTTEGGNQDGRTA